MKNHVNALLLTAAFSGLIGGTSVAAAQAAAPATQPTVKSSAKVLKAGYKYAG